MLGIPIISRGIKIENINYRFDYKFYPLIFKIFIRLHIILSIMSMYKFLNKGQNTQMYLGTVTVKIM